MALLLTLTSLSGAGKSEVFDYVQKTFPDFFSMNSYTSRPKRQENEGGYEFHDKQFFIDNENDFMELSTYPPHSDPKEETVHFYGKHKSQFDGKNYIMTLDDVGVESFKKLYAEKKLLDYRLITIFVTCDEKIRMERIGQDAKRDARDMKRKLLPLESYDYVLDNSGSKADLFKLIDQLFEKIN